MYPTGHPQDGHPRDPPSGPPGPPPPPPPGPPGPPGPPLPGPSQWGHPRPDQNGPPPPHPPGHQYGAPSGPPPGYAYPPPPHGQHPQQPDLYPGHYAYNGYGQPPPTSQMHTFPQPAPRQRTAIACRYCRRRKIRCSGFESSPDGRCTNCIRFNQECVFTPVSSQTQAFVPAHTAYPQLRNGAPPGPNAAPTMLYGAHGQPLPYGYPVHRGPPPPDARPPYGPPPMQSPYGRPPDAPGAGYGPPRDGPPPPPPHHHQPSGSGSYPPGQWNNTSPTSPNRLPPPPTSFAGSPPASYAATPPSYPATSSGPGYYPSTTATHRNSPGQYPQETAPPTSVGQQYPFPATSQPPRPSSSGPPTTFAPMSVASLVDPAGPGGQPLRSAVDNSMLASFMPGRRTTNGGTSPRSGSDSESKASRN